MTSRTEHEASILGSEDLQEYHPSPYKTAILYQCH